MKTQNIYAAVIIVNFIIDQTLIGIIQLNYETLGEQNVFKIWWIFHLWEIIEVHVIANIVIIKQLQQMEEYNGYIGRQFPGQEKPRTLPVEPDRVAVTQTEQYPSQEKPKPLTVESEKAGVTDTEELSLQEEARVQSSIKFHTANELLFRETFTATELIQVEIH